MVFLLLICQHGEELASFGVLGKTLRQVFVDSLASQFEPAAPLHSITPWLLLAPCRLREKGKKGDRWEYKRPKDGSGNIKYMFIDWKQGTFHLRMDKADLSEVTNPVTICVQIGDCCGTETIQMEEKKYHWEYKYKPLKSLKPPKPPKPLP